MATRLTAPIAPMRWRSASTSALISSQLVLSNATKSCSVGSPLFCFSPPALGDGGGRRKAGGRGAVRTLDVGRCDLAFFFVEIEVAEAFRFVVRMPEQLLPIERPDVHGEFVRELLAEEADARADLGDPDLVLGKL